jgi:hypothetical protein
MTGYRTTSLDCSHIGSFVVLTCAVGIASIAAVAVCFHIRLTRRQHQRSAGQRIVCP